MGPARARDCARDSKPPPAGLSRRPFLNRTSGRPPRGLLREQLLARAPGTRLLFPRKGGSPWRHGHFYAKTWVPTRRRAQREWRREHGLDDDAATPFDGLRPHDLRHTAATVLCEHILDDALVALRLGHNDGGRLVRERYRHVGRRKLRAELDRTDAAGGLLAASAAGAR
jgi:integrase